MKFTFLQLRAAVPLYRVVFKEYVLFGQYSQSDCDGLGSFGHGGDTCCSTILFVLFGWVVSVNLALKIQAAVLYNVCTVGDDHTKTI